ncbi:MAG: PCRF domain-containing protein, partial [Calditrichaeota bacterium]|nr:PCRF domain-containing protein [Calditrichota bacterium]
MAELEAKTSQINFWDSPEDAQQILRILNEKKERLDDWKDHQQQLEDMELMLEMAREADDAAVLADLDRESQVLADSVKDLELRGLLSAPEDKKNAILTIHPGAGGTE